MTYARLRIALTALAAALIFGLPGSAFVAPVAAPARAQPGALPLTVTATQGLFLHISDIHFDPFADQTIVPQLMAAPVEQWQSIFENAAQTGFAQYGQDTNYRLLVSALSAAAGGPYDYILFTGDALAHGFHAAFIQAGGEEKDYEAFVIKTLRFVNLLLKNAFPASPLVSTLGNNDATCGDYMLAPNSRMLTALGHDLPLVAANPQALGEFVVGGFYKIPHPKVPKHDIIVLSDVFWSVQYHDNCDRNDGDPGAAQLAWLEWTLYQGKTLGRSASLVMHIPAGINAYSSSRQACPQGIVTMWRADYTDRFLSLVRSYHDMLRVSYAGHTHMDDFRVVSGAAGKPLLVTRINPSISPIFGNNPAFSAVVYDRNSAAVADYAVFYLSNLAAIGGGVSPLWSWEYTFSQAFGPRRYEPVGMRALANSIRTDPAVGKVFMDYYASSAPSPINPGNLTAYACAQTALTPADYEACRCPTTPTSPANRETER